MKVKRFTGNDMQETIYRIKSELGDDALIIHSRKFKRKGLLGFFRPRRVEVIAAVEDKPQRVENDMAEVKQELLQVKQLVNRIARRADGNGTQTLHVTDEVKEITRVLFDNRVEREIVSSLIRELVRELSFEELSNREQVTVSLKNKLKKVVRTAPPIDPGLGKNTPHTAVLIGPTGVGKTTTIAKLAATFSLFKQKNVALITVDTYRISAVEQLKTYSRIIDIPIEVAFTPEEMEEALASHTDKDLILIDTAGRSQRDRMQLSELKNYLEIIKPQEVYLVLSATTKTEDLLEIIEKFSIGGREKLIFTKLDETTTVGPIINTLAQTEMGVSYITNGQDVPDDIEIARPAKLLQSMFEEV